MIVKKFSVWIKLNYLVCFRSVERAAVLIISSVDKLADRIAAVIPEML